MSLTDLKGVGPKTEKILNKMKIYESTDLLWYFPRNYDIYEKPIYINQIDNRAIVSIDGIVEKSINTVHANKLTISSTTVRDENGDSIKVSWYNMPFLKSTIKYSMRFIFRGRIKRIGKNIVLEQPAVFTLQKYSEKINNMQPMYPLVKGASNNQICKFVKESLEINRVSDYLDENIRKKYKICNLEDAIKNIHFPENFESLKCARKRLVFDEFFSFIYQMTKLKENEIKIPNRYKINNYNISDNVIENLPYELTKAQKRVLADIRKDMLSENVMQRLVQGDVGSGKTIIAFLARQDLWFPQKFWQNSIMKICVK